MQVLPRRPTFGAARNLTCGLAAIVALAAVFIGPASATAQTPLVIVVHTSSPIEDISLDDLRRLFEGRVTTVMGIPSVSLYQHTPSREQFYEQVLNTTVSRAIRAWMALVFSGEISKPPVDIEQAGDLIDAVASRRSALGFVPFSAVDTSRVRVIPVNGLSVGDVGYVLR